MKTQEEYALEIDEIVRRDVESRQSDWFKIDKEIFMQPENKNKAFILGTRKTGCDLIILGGTNCDEGSMDWLFGSLGFENGTYMKIEYIQKCKCGAVTIRFDNSASNSMFWETFEKLDLDTGDATWLHQSYCCDHCVNHWGIGLCGCGSGQKVGKCECGSQKAHDILGVKYDSFGAILKNFG